MNSKGQAGLGTLITVIVIFLLTGLAAIYSLDILDDTKEDFCDYTYYNGACIGCTTAGYLNLNTSDYQCYNATTGDIKKQAPNQLGENSFNSSLDVETGVAKIPEKMPTLGNVTIAAIIIGVLLAAFGGFMATRE